MGNQQLPTVTIATGVTVTEGLLGYVDADGAKLASTTVEAEFRFNNPGTAGQQVSVTPLNLIGHGDLVAAGAITAFAQIYQAAGGKVDDTSGDFRVGQSTSTGVADKYVSAFVRPLRMPE
jgi:hypothetical protein